MREKKIRKKHRIRRLIMTLLFLLVLLCGSWYLLLDKLYEKLNYEEIESLKGQSYKAEGVTNILLIGNDSRTDGEDGRSDAMILLSVSSKTKTIQMTSFLRDMYVEIPGHGGNRLNAAYAYGGPSQAVTM